VGQRPDVRRRETAARDVLTRHGGAFSLDARLIRRLEIVILPEADNLSCSTVA
jgi:hypothetical protein